MKSKTDINTKKYFDSHFDETIKRNDKNLQTIFFCRLALKYLPKWLEKEFKRGLSIADVGCAMGECVNIIQKKYILSKVTGIDFSPVAIAGAKQKFPKQLFLCSDISNIEKKYDVIFCSNTLEHFYNPIAKLQQISKKANKYIILLLPFQEYERTSSHFYTFDFNNIPLKLNDFYCVDVKIFSTWKMKNNHWPGTPKSPGKQILLIYSKNNFLIPKKLYLDSIIPENIINDDMHLKLHDLNQQINKIHGSNLWRIALFYYKIRDSIFFFLK